MGKKQKSRRGSRRTSRVNKKAKIKKASKKAQKKPQRISDKQLEKAIMSIIAEIAEVDEKKVGLTTKFVEDLDINSMMALEILAAVEKRYKIEIPEDNLPEMRCLKDVLKLTQKMLL